MKLSYSEQYRHPKWQRRRLERLKAAGWECQECGSTEKTLNVHHKLYVKGRMVWEYTDDEIVVLCEKCHATHHDYRKAIEQEIAGADLFQLPMIHALLVGYRGGLVASEGVPDQYATDNIFPGDECSHAFRCGELAMAFGDLTAADVRRVIDLFNKLNPDGFRALIGRALEATNTEA